MDSLFRILHGRNAPWLLIFGMPRPPYPRANGRVVPSGLNGNVTLNPVEGIYFCRGSCKRSPAETSLPARLPSTASSSARAALRTSRAMQVAAATDEASAAGHLLADAVVQFGDLRRHGLAEISGLEHWADLDLTRAGHRIGAALQSRDRLGHVLDLPQPEAGHRSRVRYPHRRERMSFPGWAVTGQAASTNQMGRFETEVMAEAKNLAALTDLSGQWIDRIHARRPLKGIVPDMDSSVSPIYGEQEGAPITATSAAPVIISVRVQPVRRPGTLRLAPWQRPLRRRLA